MSKVRIVAVTMPLASFFVTAYGYLVIQVGKQSTQGTNAGLLAVAVLLVAYLVWLFVAENSVLSEGPLEPKKWSNFKRTVVALSLCVPAALLFVGMLAPPFIVAMSALGLGAKAVGRARGVREP